MDSQELPEAFAELPEARADFSGALGSSQEHLLNFQKLVWTYHGTSGGSQELPPNSQELAWTSQEFLVTSTELPGVRVEFSGARGSSEEPPLDS